MRYLSILLLIGVTLKVNGQQINPVPDYIFRNQMSVGRNAPTDTAAYLSVGPRYGANKGFMPPMVVDTASITGTKRNGLLIFSIQKNNFAYWDSVRVRWADITASVDSLVYSTKAWRKKGDDSLAAIINTRTDTVNLLSTKAWRQKGIDSVVSLVGSGLTGTGISGYMPKWTGAKALDTSQIFQLGGNIGIGTALPSLVTTGRKSLVIRGTTAEMLLQSSNTTDGGILGVAVVGVGNDMSFVNRLAGNFNFFTNSVEVFRIHGNGRLTVNTVTDAGYQFDVAGSMRNTTNAYFNTSSGESYYGTTSDFGDYRVQVSGNAYVSGKMGIGTATTAFTLTVGGGIKALGGGEFASTLLTSGDTIGGAIILRNPQTNPNTGASSTIYSVGNAQNGTGANNSELNLHVAGWSSPLSDGPAILMRGNNFARFSNARGSIEHRAGVITSPVGNDGAVLFTSPSSFIDLRTGGSFDSRLRITVDGESLFGTTTDAGAYRVQISGAVYGTAGGVLAATSGELLVGGTTDNGAYVLQSNGAFYTSSSITTGAPTGGTAQPWKLGTVATVSPTSPNRTIEVEINGTTYYLHAKTTND